MRPVALAVSADADLRHFVREGGQVEVAGVPVVAMSSIFMDLIVLHDRGDGNDERPQKLNEQRVN